MVEEPKPEEKKKNYLFKVSISALIISTFLLIATTSILVAVGFNEPKWNYCDEACFHNGLGRSTGIDEQQNCRCDREIITVTMQDQPYYLMCDFGIKAEENIQDIEVLNSYNCVPLQQPQQ